MKKENLLFFAEMFCTLLCFIGGFILLFVSFELTDLELDTRKLLACIAFSLFLISILIPELFSLLVNE